MRVLATVIGRYLLVTPAKRPFQRRLLAWGGAVAALWLILLLLPGVLPTGLWTGRIVLGILLYGGGLLGIRTAVVASRLLFNERESRALELLAMSDLGGGRLLAYLYVVGMLDAMMILALAIPVFAWCANLPLVGPQRALAGFLLLVVFNHGAAVFGLLVAACGRHRQTAALYGVLGGYLLCFGVPALMALLNRLAGRAWDWGVVTVSPLWAGVMLCGGDVSEVPGSLLFAVVAGGAGLWLAARALPARLAPATSRPLQEWWARLRHRRRYLRPPPLMGNPVAWRDFHFLYGGQLWVWVGVVVFLAVMGLWVGAASGFSLAQVPVLLAQGLGMCCFLMVVPATMATQALLRERQQGTLELLLATGLSNREVLLGKTEGLLRFSAPWVVIGVTSWVTVCAAWVRDGYWPPVVLANLLLWPALVGWGLGSFEEALRLAPDKVRTVQTVMPKFLLYPAAGGLLAVGAAGLALWQTGQERWAAAAGSGPVLAATALMLWRIRWRWRRLNQELRELAVAATVGDAERSSRG